MKTDIAHVISPSTCQHHANKVGKEVQGFDLTIRCLVLLPKQLP